VLRNRGDKSWLNGIVTENPPQNGDPLREAAFRHVGIRPDSTDELLFRDEAVLVPDEDQQQIERLGRQFDLYAILGELAGAHVEAKRTEFTASHVKP
jgi:hypothetical protein